MRLALLFAILLMAKDGDRVADPYKEEKFTCVGAPESRLFLRPSERAGYGAFRVRADLNFDGREDLILAAGKNSDDAGCGNAGCPVVIYLKQPDGVFSKVHFFLHPLALSLSKSSDGGGLLSIYMRSSAQEGAIIGYRVTANSLVAATSREFHANIQDDQLLYNSMFRSPIGPKAEFARCTKGALEWSKDYL